MIRVKSPLEAIGELSDPIDERSPKSAIVIVGSDAALEAGTGNGRDGTDEFVRGLRLVDPRVRVLRTLGRSELGEGQGWSHFDGVIDPEAGAEALRAIIHRKDALGADPGSSGSGSPLRGPALPLGAEPKPATGAVPEGDVAPPIPFAGDEAASEETGDSALVRLVLRGGDVGAAAIDLIRARLGDTGVTFEAGGAGAVREGGVPVEFEGGGARTACAVAGRVDEAERAAGAASRGGVHRSAYRGVEPALLRQVPGRGDRACAGCAAEHHRAGLRYR
jgi:hypothetical protein